MSVDQPTPSSRASRPLAVIVLAAGLGTRMKSDLPKVLHPVCGRPLLAYVLDAAAALAPARMVVVTGRRRTTQVAAVLPRRRRARRPGRAPGQRRRRAGRHGPARRASRATSWS